MPFTDQDREAAAEAGRKGAAEQARRRALEASDPERYLIETFSAKKTKLAKQLLDAALGEDEWAALPLDKRLTALFKALEYAVGKPAQQKAAPVEAEKPETGLSIE